MDMNKLYKFQDSWVAFNKDRKKIIANAKNLDKLLKLIKKREDLIISFIPRSDVFLSP